MKQPVSAAVGRVVADLRRRCGLTQPALGARLADRTALRLGQGSISQIELHQRGRQVTVDELIGLAIALDVSPFVLLAPAVTEAAQELIGRPITEARAADWLLGTKPLPRQDAQLFRDNRPAHLLYISSGPTALPAVFLSFNLAVAGLRRAAEEKDRQALLEQAQRVRQLLDAIEYEVAPGLPPAPPTPVRPEQ